MTLSGRNAFLNRENGSVTPGGALTFGHGPVVTVILHACSMDYAPFPANEDVKQRDLSVNPCLPVEAM